MKNNIIILSILLLWLFQPVQLKAQKKEKVVKTELKAQVVDRNGQAIEGVLVTANEGEVQTKTDESGNFVLSINGNAAIVFEANGYDQVITNNARIGIDFNKVSMQPTKDINIDGVVRLPFQTLKRSQTTGNISVIDAEKSLQNDSRMEIAAHLIGKVTGALGAWDYHGLGNAITVVDGVIREARFLNMMEVEQVTVLKDAYSRMLYGADGDAPVILITTKSGTKFKKVLNFNIQQGVQTAIAKPKFLDAASYMETYNKAYNNDGLGASFYRQGVIDSTRSNLDPIRYPNNDYWSSQYVKNAVPYTSAYGEASGGNDKVQYLMTLGWKHDSGWLAIPDKDESNLLSLRGKVDFEVTSWLKMKADIVALFDLYSGPQTYTFYSDASKLLPNSFPLLIPMNRVLNDSVLAGKFPVGNSLIGGTSVYTQNLYGEMTRGGSRTDLGRFLQYMVGFDIDLKKVTKGLTVSGLVDLDFYNYYSQYIDNEYAVYEAKFVNDPINAIRNGNYNLTKIGEDKFTSSQTLGFGSFSRVYSGYVNANYNRIFGKHQVSAVALGYYKQDISNSVNQDSKRLRFGAQANYTYDDKYIVEAGVLREGFTKLNPNVGRFKTSPSVGASWIVSNEGFMNDNTIFDYLKLRATYGQIYNDNWGSIGKYAGYYLYEQSYVQGLGFTYNNAAGTNSTIDIMSLANRYDAQKRSEFVGGFDAYLFNKKLWLETSYWNSLSSGNLVELIYNTPSTMGLTPVTNFNATRYQGVEVGLNYSEKMGDLNFSVGLNYLLSTSSITKWDEPTYPAENAHLSKVGTSERALWGLTSTGLYSATDFEADGKTLIADLAKPTYGVVRPGDIKYKDVNEDGKISNDDFSVLGLQGNNQQMTLNINLNYKKWQLFVLGVGSWGGKSFTSSNYYWFKGNEAKYSEVALKAYDPANPNPNAEYPRLSLTNGNNNYINSTFWMYDRTLISLSNVQLSYNFEFAPTAPLKTLKVFVRGSNLLTLGKNVDIMQLNYNSSPQTRGGAVGIIANF